MSELITDILILMTQHVQKVLCIINTFDINSKPKFLQMLPTDRDGIHFQLLLKSNLNVTMKFNSHRFPSACYDQNTVKHKMFQVLH